MHRIIPCILVFAILSPARIAPAAAPDERLWPLPLETRYLTSNFMEHRSGRFHAGLDLKTDSRSGFPVMAVEAGWISRIRVSPSGYGKTIYLRGDSGRTYVYAHLSRIGNRWRDQIRRTQARRDRYDVTLHFPAGKYDVRRGEVLALSGQSGTGGPHLHFEVRDGANRPLDPQAHGFAVPDTMAPVIHKVRVMPAAPEARVEGDLFAYSVSGDPLTGELPRLRVAGSVAFTAQVLEIADIKGHKLEPYRLSVSLDDSLVYETRNEVYDFAAQHHMRLEWRESADSRDRWLHRRPGNNLPGRLGGTWSLDPAVLRPGRHVVRLEVADRAGNASAVHWSLVVFKDAPGEPPASQGGWDRDPVRIEWSTVSNDDQWMTPYLGRNADGTVFAQRGTGAAPLTLSIHTQIPDSLTAAERRAAVRKQGLYSSAWCVRILAADWTTAKPVSYAMAHGLPDTIPDNLGFYLQNHRGWSYVGKPQRQGEHWMLEAAGPGRYALFVDRNAPYLGPGPDEGIVRGAAASTVDEVSAPVWEIFIIRAEDMGAGVNPASVAVKLDARPLIVEADPPRDRLLIELPDDTPPGRHRLDVHVIDYAGRVTERSYDLNLIP